jgi:hypothetical protein
MLLATLLALAAQDASVARPETAADGTKRWSILIQDCPPPPEGQIVVCGSNAAPPLPFPDTPPDRPVPSNPNLSGSGALAATVSPCATRSEGCTTGVDLFGMATFAVRAVGKLIDPGSCCEEPGEATNPALLVKDAVRAAKRVGRKKPDKSMRVPIPMDDPAPAESEAMRSVVP